jgi:hypothetical protein
VTDRIDELQRLHEIVATTRAAAIADESRLAAFAYARHNLANAAEEHLPALLRVARAARKVADDLRGDEAVDDLHEALAELDKP